MPLHWIICFSFTCNLVRKISQNRLATPACLGHAPPSDKSCIRHCTNIFVCCFFSKKTKDSLRYIHMYILLEINFKSDCIAFYDL